MKASELRIGNYVDLINRSHHIHLPYGGIFKVGPIEFFKAKLYDADKNFAIQGSHIDADIKDLSPIPITTEWLEKFGFGEDVTNYEWRTNNGFCIDTFSDIPGFWLLSSYRENTKVQYVHQLQNLYFALTGTELTLTPSNTERAQEGELLPAEGQGKGVCRDKDRHKDGPCKYPRGTCEWCTHYGP